jgi:hypothetical protein
MHPRMSTNTYLNEGESEGSGFDFSEEDLKFWAVEIPDAFPVHLVENVTNSNEVPLE